MIHRHPSHIWLLASCTVQSANPLNPSWCCASEHYWQVLPLQHHSFQKKQPDICTRVCTSGKTLFISFHLTKSENVEKTRQAVWWTQIFKSQITQMYLATYFSFLLFFNPSTRTTPPVTELVLHNPVTHILHFHFWFSYLLDCWAGSCCNGFWYQVLQEKKNNLINSIKSSILDSRSSCIVLENCHKLQGPCNHNMQSKMVELEEAGETLFGEKLKMTKAPFMTLMTAN